MAEIKWMQPNQKGRDSKGNDLDVYISNDSKGRVCIKFVNEGFNAIAQESIYLEVSHPDAYELHFKQYNKKPEKRWSAKITTKTIVKCIRFTPYAAVKASFNKWAGKKYKVHNSIEHNTFYIRLEQGIKEDNNG